MHRAFARVRVLKFAAATSLVSAAAVATPTPAGILALEQQAVLAALASGPQTPELDPGSLQVAEKVDTVRIRERAKGELASLRQRSALSAEDLPSSGQIDGFEITAPDDGKVEPLVFTPRTARL